MTTIYPNLRLYIAILSGGIALLSGWLISDLPDEYNRPETFALLIMGLVGIIILWQSPELGLGLYLYNGVFKTAPIFSDPNSTLPTFFILSLSIIPLLLREKFKIRFNSILVLILVFNLLCLLSAFGISQITDKAMRLAFFTTASLTLAALIVHNPERLLRAFRYLCLLAVVLNFLSFINFVFGEIAQVRSVTLFDANDVIYGRAVALGIVMTIGLLLYEKTLPTLWRRLFLWMLPLAFVNLILSTSRGGVVGFLVTIIFLLFLNRVRFPRWIWGILILTGPIYYFVVTIWGHQVIDLSGLGVLVGYAPLDLSILNRITMYWNAVDVFFEHPLFGVGLGPNSTYPHNIFLEIASELGFVGLSLFSLLLWQIFLKVRHLMDVIKEERYYSIVNLIAIGLVYSITISQFSGNLQHQRALWLFIALTWAMAVPTKQNIVAQ